MRRRIFLSLLLVASAMLAACFGMLVAGLYLHSSAMQEQRLAEMLDAAVRAAGDGAPFELPGGAESSFRLTRIRPDGSVVSDSRGDPAAMENHAARSEVRDALARGFGRSIRHSDTLSEETAYFARRLGDGTVLRISQNRATAFRLACDFSGWFLVGVACLIAASAFASRKLAERIVEPFNRLDLDHPLENRTYDELAPLLGRLERQHRQIDEQLGALKRQADEFERIVEAMEEGLVILDPSGRILSINPAACRFFNAAPSCRGAHLRTINREQALHEALRQAMLEGRGGLRTGLGGRVCHVGISRLVSGDDVLGAAVIVCDVTALADEERRRKEFTANVSHELKTPLQSIIGASELMAGGLVAAGDMQAFASRIHGEGMRMASLIGDILRLSRLDEGAELECCDLALDALAAETAERFRGPAAEAGVTIGCECAPVHVSGERGLLSELMSNLVENAVKYNRQGGRVTVRTGLEEGRPFLSVADTGIGIAEKDKDRIFERFYRVDKSRSRRTGGTGLGLSIVKHAALLHHAEISLESAVGRGTTVTVRFPRMRPKAAPSAGGKGGAAA